MIVIGERINATRKAIRQAITARDADHIRHELVSQIAAGATFIDLNAGTGVGGVDEEVEDMRWLVDLALEVTEKPLAIDSADPVVLTRAAEHLAGRRSWMLNSVHGDSAELNTLLTLAAEHDADVIALGMDADGIPSEAAPRVAICRRIAEISERVGLAQKKLYFDPLVLPLSADVRNGAVTLETLDRIRAELPETRTVVGLSNISYGLPERGLVNAEFLVAALSHGLDAAICDPTRPTLRRAILAGELVAGRDRYCRKFTRAVRQGML
jgi:cobalamin-dependent methionine synthase I